MAQFHTIIIGAGPAGIFTALEMLRQGSSQNILMIEQGLPIGKRACPKAKTNRCMNCQPYCHITAGFSGAGAFSDGKLSLSYEVGGDLPELLGADQVQQLIDYTDSIYLEFGADPHVEGVENPEAIKQIRRRAIKAGLKLVDCPIRHLGTELAQDLYGKIQDYLIEHGVEIRFRTVCRDLVIDANNVCTGAIIASADKKEDMGEVITGKHIVVAAGRKGADWLDTVCRAHGVDREPGVVDIGVRVEVRNEIMEEVNKVLYESKLIGYPAPFGNKVRTFCQNPGGFVSQENYDGGLAVVNGHSYKNTKSNNTNLAILCSHHFRVPFDEPIQYAQMIGRLSNMLGADHILVQRFGDILEGKRTWQQELARSNVRPTLPDAVAGDITSALPYRTMTNIVNFIKALDEVVPGFASAETLLYAPEIKFYSNRVKMDETLHTSVQGLHSLGDASGWTRGLMMASCMGVKMAQVILAEENLEA